MWMRCVLRFSVVKVGWSSRPSLESLVLVGQNLRNRESVHPDFIGQFTGTRLPLDPVSCDRVFSPTILPCFNEVTIHQPPTCLPRLAGDWEGQ